MQQIARKILESSLFEKKIPTKDDFTDITPLLNEKIPVFVTLLDGTKIIGSSGRIYPIHEKGIEELVENTLLAIKDPRFDEYRNNSEKVRKIRYRIDIFHDKDRRLLKHPDELNVAVEGIILLCQKQQKATIILPHILSPNLSGEEVYHKALEKSHIDAKHLGKGDVILYGLRTETFQDNE